MFDDLPSLDLDAPAFFLEQENRIQGDQLPERISGYEHDPRHERKIERRRKLRLLRNGEAIRVLDHLPAEGEEVLIVMAGTYHGIDLVDAILALADSPAEQVYLSTLGTNKSNIAAIIDHLDAGRIQNLTFVVADVFAQKDGAEFAYLNREIGGRGHRIIVARNHAKLCLFRFADGRHIALHGSLNLRRCNSFEQVAISHDQDTYRFFAEFIEDIAAEGIEV